MCPLPSQPGVGQLGNNNNRRVSAGKKQSPQAAGPRCPPSPRSGWGGSSRPQTLAPSIRPQHLCICLHANKPAVSLSAPFPPFFVPKRSQGSWKKFEKKWKKMWKMCRRYSKYLAAWFAWRWKTQSSLCVAWTPVPQCCQYWSSGCGNQFIPWKHQISAFWRDFLF